MRARVPLKVITEKDQGMYVDAICVFEKRPIIHGTRVLDDIEAQRKGYRVESFVIQYRYYFRLDLWIFIIDLDWEGRQKTPRA